MKIVRRHRRVEKYAIRSAMLSVIVATHNSERALVQTLAALVPGATAGLIREVIVVDSASTDATAEVADIAGCRLITADAPIGRCLRAGAETARAPWLMFLAAGAVPQSGWVDEATRFIEEAARAGRAEEVAAAFRAVSPTFIVASRWRETITLIAQALGVVRRTTHGLLLTKQLYLRMSRQDAEASELELVRRLGRRRIVTLQSGAVRA